jgi:hypothetical protein
MINQGNNVPDNTIAIFPQQLKDGSYFDIETIYSIIEPSSRKRDWFTPHFYRCLPLTIANGYGFIIKSSFDIGFVWNGGDQPEDITLFFNEDIEKLEEKYPSVASHFGSGILTINVPFSLRTPPGVNLLTINPPNHVLPNVTVMSGSVETDNLRRDFSFNLKIQIPNLPIYLPAGTPLAAVIPIPRYYADSFKLEDANNIFSKDAIEEESSCLKSAYEKRENGLNFKNRVDKDYYSGKDAFGNLFPDHQKP